jgi:uncharacterized protein (DUF1800 family)/Fe2+ transport system protein FeoA
MNFMTKLPRGCCLVLLTSLLAGALQAQTITITPKNPFIGVGLTQQFTAAVSGLANNDVTWSLSGMGTNNPKLGTISATGLYTAPAVPPAQNPVSVLATGADGKTIGLTYVLVEPSGPTLTSISPNPIPIGSHLTYTVTVTGSGFQPGAQLLAGPNEISISSLTATQLVAGGYQETPGAVVFKVKNPGSTYSNSISATFVTANDGGPITVSPATASVALGATQKFKASGQSSVTWSASAGTITSAGLFTAPTTMPSSSIVTITASGTNNQSGSATVTLTQPLGGPITVSPSTASVALGATQQFTASGQSSVTWSASAGTITSTGLFAAPATMPSSSTVTITASGSNNQSGSATVTLTQPLGGPITVSPSTASVALGATQQFTASGQTSVTWTASSGTITSAGLFTAPTTMPSSSTVTITASGSNSQSGTATVTLTQPVGGPITVSPSNASVALGATQQFTASGQTSVTWTASAGTITSAGLFTAPTTMPSSSSVTITASGTNNQSASATVTLTGGPVMVSAAAARRFLQQAAFGPTTADAAHVQAIGFQAWLNEQFAMPKVSNYQGPNLTNQGGLPNRFLANAVTNPDQLRQRAAFALSQIAVISLTTLNFDPDVVPFEEMLLNDAFANYRQVLGDVTLSASMGDYLNMANNAAANSAAGTVANENYAREIMQLFSIGTALLNQDGSRQTDASGNPIATYNQSNVTELARVFTGWTYAQSNGTAVNWGGTIDGNADPTQPMVPVPAFHDSGSKTLLPDFVNGNGTSPYVAPSGLTPQVDLSQALDNLFGHPNVGPFIGKELIQHLVKSNPSPAYVARVSAAFANNGQGVRGDMQAVLTAILLDPEARANDDGANDQSTDGHLQEPALYLAGVVRALNGIMNDQNYFSYDLANMGQDIFNPASVFNYYSPSYGIPQTTLKGGEFQIFNTYSSLYRANLISNVFNNYSNPVQTYGPGMTVDFTPFVTLVTTSPSAMVDALDLALTRGVMPSAMKQIILTAVEGETGGPLRQVQTAFYLIVASNYYNVWH